MGYGKRAGENAEKELLRDCEMVPDMIGEILRNPGVDLHVLALKITLRLRRIEQSRIDRWKKF